MAELMKRKPQAAEKKKTLSIISILILVFVAIYLVSSVGIGYTVFSNWRQSAQETTQHHVNYIKDNLHQNIDMFLQIPVNLNETHYRIIENGILDINNPNDRARFFAGALQSQPDVIYSFSIGLESGEYYGARRNKQGELEIMVNNEDTNGQSWYYAANDDLTAGALVLQTDRFDPRERAWYQAAAQLQPDSRASSSPDTAVPDNQSLITVSQLANQPSQTRTVFSPVYKHFVMDDLTVSIATPLYDHNQQFIGVLGTHMLLSNIGQYLNDAVDEYQGFAFLVEKESGYLIANSMGAPNYVEDAQNAVTRRTLQDIVNFNGLLESEQIQDDIPDSQSIDLSFSGSRETYITSTEPFTINGLSWQLITGIPESLLLARVYQTIRVHILLNLAVVFLALIIFFIITRRLMNPLTNLLSAAEEFSGGNISKRVSVNRNDEIGRISQSFNHIATNMQNLVENLESTVQQRTSQLNEANSALATNRNQLKLILDSTAEAIYGIDTEGNCTFCNISGLKLLGYDNQNELLGKNMHQLIHHSKADVTPMPSVECRVFMSLEENLGMHTDDEVFWKADGTPIEVEYYAYPQIVNGQTVGAVVTFMDISERKKRDEQIKYLSFHDTLTGLPNRRGFENSRFQLDQTDQLPLSVIFADINGLKLTNDVFGHEAGDTLIRKSADILRHICREDDLIARIGGDEFVVLLPKTNTSQAEKVVERIREEFAKAKIEAIKCSISLGLDTKTTLNINLTEVMTNAENRMYQDKTLNKAANREEIFRHIERMLYGKNANEMRHAKAVSHYARQFAEALKLSDTDIDRISQAGYYHDIGKITLKPNVLSNTKISEEEQGHKQQHPTAGYRLLNLFDHTIDLANAVMSHHEYWNGEGFPKGLTGEKIPLASRIIAIAEFYDRLIHDQTSYEVKDQRQALTILRQQAGKRFDPKLVERFIDLVRNTEDHF